MKFKNILGILGTVYAAGVAIAMKKRKDQGISKLAEKTTDSTLQNVMDEITEIHKNTYADVKKFFVVNFEDVKDVESLTAKVGELSENFKNRIEMAVADMKNNAGNYKENAQKFLEEAYNKAKTSLSHAEEKVKTFSEDKKEIAQKFVAESKEKIEKTYTELKNSFTK